MSANGEQPFIKVTDSNGNPIVGAVLKVYEVGTTTNRAIYSDAALTTPLTNPLSGANASNASGDFPRFYMASGTYKLRAETSGGFLIWEYDNIDTGVATGNPLAVVSGGTGATTAAAALTNLGAAAASDVTALAAQISTVSAAVSSVVSQPQGRLTLASAIPVLSSTISASASVYYTPYIGTLCPIWNGSIFVSTVCTELTLSLSSSHTLNSIFDCFVINDSGTVRLVTGPAWSTITAGSGARGTGGGTTELTRTGGLLVNANSMSARNGATTYTVTAQQGTYVGSIYIDGTAGQVTCHVDFGQARKWGVWNAYNRVPIILQCGTSTSAWTNTPSSWRQSFADALNYGMGFCGLAEEEIDAQFNQYVTLAAAGGGNTTIAQIGIGVNVTNAPTGMSGTMTNVNNVTGTALTIGGILKSTGLLPPKLGINQFNMIEQAVAGATNNNYQGTSANMLLKITWRG